MIVTMPDQFDIASQLTICYDAKIDLLVILRRL